ncbi:MAG: hypothetical protein JNM27_15490 [Leptospirales bacterium]|nr:hypothetical protein [Leptospirales bacterium]
MPYVQRDFKGKVLGLFAVPQSQEDGTPISDPDPLPDDHPDVVAFQLENPTPPFLTKSLSKTETRAFEVANEKATREVLSLKHLILSHIQEWAELETALSLLFQEILGLPNPRHNLARTIYHSLGTFETRKKMLTNVVDQLVEDCAIQDRKTGKDLEVIRASWKTICLSLDTAQKIRNTVAHGHVSKIHHRKKITARLTSPFFDPKDDRLLARGSMPGLGSNDMESAVKRLRLLTGCMDRLNESVRAFYQFGVPGMEAKLDRLKLNLKRLKP